MIIGPRRVYILKSSGNNMNPFKEQILATISLILIAFNIYLIVEDKIGILYLQPQILGLAVCILLISLPEKEDNSEVNILKVKVDRLETGINLLSDWIIATEDSKEEGFDPNH